MNDVTLVLVTIVHAIEEEDRDENILRTIIERHSQQPTGRIACNGRINETTRI